MEFQTVPLPDQHVPWAGPGLIAVGVGLLDILTGLLWIKIDIQNFIQPNSENHASQKHKLYNFVKQDIKLIF